MNRSRTIVRYKKCVVHEMGDLRRNKLSSRCLLPGTEKKKNKCKVFTEIIFCNDRIIIARKKFNITA